MTEKGERRRQHYQSVYERNLPVFSKGRAVDESLHYFLDQRPSGKSLSALERAQGLVAASFWLDADAVAQSELASMALGRALHVDDAVSTELLLHLAMFGNPYVTLRGAVNQFMEPQFEPDDADANYAAGLQNGTRISLICTGRGDVAKTPMPKDYVPAN